MNVSDALYGFESWLLYCINLDKLIPLCFSFLICKVEKVTHMIAVRIREINEIEWLG